MKLETVKTVNESMVFKKTSDNEFFCKIKVMRNKNSADCEGYDNYLINTLNPTVFSYLAV